MDRRNNNGLQHLVILAGLWLFTGVAILAAEISITNTNGLGFGSLIAGAGSGTVTVNSSASRTCTGDIICIPQSGGKPARFNVTGDPQSIYIITLPPSTMLNNVSGQSMLIENFTNSEGGNGSLDAAGKGSFSIGATLQVGAGQSTGAYSGSFEVLVEYQ